MDIKTLDIDKVRALINTYLKERLDCDEEIRANDRLNFDELRKTLGKAIAKSNEVPAYDKSEANSELALHYKNALRSNDYSAVESEFRYFADSIGLNPNKIADYTRSIISREIVKMNIDLYTILSLRDKCEYDLERDYLRKTGFHVIQTQPEATCQPQQTLPVPSSPSQPVHGPRLSEAIKQYLASAPLKDRSRKQYSDNLNTLMEIVGDIELTQITHATARHFRDTLRKLPAHRNKKKEYRGKSIPELLEMVVESKMADRTVESILTTASAFSNWCIDEGYVEFNFFANKAPKGAKKSKSNREGFTTEELQKIFRSDEYVNDSFSKSYQFWSIPLALYTGARQSEIGQLRVGDIFQRQGIWCIGINDEDEDKSVKSKAGMRIVPLHPVLVEQLKFVEYVQRLRDRGETQVFPDLKVKNGSWGQKISEWFRDFKKKYRIAPTKPRHLKDFHSFRKTFLTQCKFQGVKTELAEQCVGHSGKSMSYDYYADDYPAKMLFDEVMLKVTYDLDLSHLTPSSWIK